MQTTKTEKKPEEKLNLLFQLISDYLTTEDFINNGRYQLTKEMKIGDIQKQTALKQNAERNLPILRTKLKMLIEKHYKNPDSGIIA